MNLAVIDLGLPDMSGLEVLSKIKANNPFIEAIILTGNASVESALEATNRGAFSYALKPYRMDQLLLQIRRALEKQQAEETIAAHNAELQKINAELARSNAELTKKIAEHMSAEEALPGEWCVSQDAARCDSYSRFL